MKMKIQKGMAMYEVMELVRLMGWMIDVETMDTLILWQKDHAVKVTTTDGLVTDLFPMYGWNHEYILRGDMEI